MGPSEVHQVLSMEARADRWYGQLLALRRRLEDPALPPDEHESVQEEAARLERELEALDRAIETRRQALGDVFT